jgi:aspartate 1-decarboxylase
MLRFMCKSKIHRATIKKCDLHYSGSIGVDKDILEASNILPNEMVQVLNVNNGERFETYAIEEERGSGTIALYGPATHKGKIGDKVIIISYCVLEEKETRSAKSRVVLVDDDNKNIRQKK